MRFIFTLLAFSIAASVVAQSDPVSSFDRAEIRIINGDKHYDPNYQAELRHQSAWQDFLQQHGTWYVHFNEENQLPHRAYGQPIPVSGADAVAKAATFIEDQLSMFNFPGFESFELTSAAPSGKNTFVNFRQNYQGLQVINSRLVVKLFENKVIMFGLDVFNDIELDITPSIGSENAGSLAVSGIMNPISTIQVSPQLQVLSIPTYRNYEHHLVYEVLVKTRNSNGVPANYLTYVDAHSGEILSRTNQIKHHHNHISDPEKPVSPPPMIVSGTLTGEVYPTHVYNPTQVLPLPNLEVVIQGNSYYTDENGSFSAPADGPVQSALKLKGKWSTVFTNGTTPTMNQVFQEGSNNVEFSQLSTNVRERSAYYHVNIIHDHHKAYMPGFDAMDYSLVTNVDVAGECNAFYDGESINFFNLGGGCNATSQLGDVVYHEYGHGINDFFYQSLGTFFNNGAMGEGYADFWAISYTDNPIMGVGFYTDNQDGIRRYDESPKVYPQDLVGEVHADGEIIMGAWYDTHLLMGADWPQTIALFVQTYSGLQAEAFNGDEGQAFTDVLIDVLQADDDDGDLSNGTPNGNAIIEGFDIHGITLLSNADLYHNDLEAAVEEEDIVINATLDLEFPFINFLQDVVLHYRLNDENTWNTITLDPAGGDNYSGVIPAQPKGTLIAYYVGITDLNNAVSNVQPIAAALETYPNLPYFILVGMEIEGVHDCDDNEDWGQWDTGVGGDNAGTGLWVFDEPVGSYTEDGIMVQVEYQHTPGGEYCFITGNAAPNDAIGTNDVDEGKTTLETSEIDMSDYTNPIVTYWRYYTNSPPGGANPGADWWQVRLSDDGGSTWQYIENTLTDDMSWRRNAFRLLDYADATDEVMLQFIASDSLHIGENLDGGSLIEAGVDDFIVYDETTGIGVEEISGENSLMVFPNPATDITWIDFTLNSTSDVQLSLINNIGEIVFVLNDPNLQPGNHRRKISVASLASGIYLVRMDTKDNSLTNKISVK